MTTAPERKLNDYITWPAVMMVAVGCATIFALVFWGKQDLLAISGFITTIATIIIGIYLRQVSKDTNGNLTKRDEEIQQLRERVDALHMMRTSEVAQLAQQVPMTSSLPSTLSADPHANGSDAFSQTTVQVPVVQRT